MQFAVIYRPLLSLVFLLLSLFPSLAQAFSSSECIITMGYRTSERLPFIEHEPNNQGFYRDIYQAAAERIGCKLRITRAPKMRILRDLKLGNIDFYPGLSFSEERAQFAYFIPNGLSERAIGISRAGAANISSLEQLSQSGMTLLIAPGSYDFNGLPETMSVRKPPELDVPKALDYLLASQGDFFIYDQATISYYLKQRDMSQFKLHPNCCQQPQAMYLGFSKKSRHFRGQHNPNYRADLPVSPDNSPNRLAEDSKAYEFAKALAAMDAEGETQRIYFNHFG
ncbi:transporter substrate-binding domain-containing protein [Shewanella xiamenensis]|uniref:substrate-binding periplasmic protein n=1 Tax=Shewanella xiamenensis TaxID=332186 RepID=UPI000C12DCE8|nr:transporter substrate-binding domain-containing protein [Shewanella xiamenensis]MBW0280076.1 amino acid ABC transporter [Shewanella xiamenensis]MBW0296736.1 amino acid ABC transporter [Shewanella xiamenensis]MDH1315808.1 transporter substrate-binding domain-containing protein [Shewanella xiamenensis]PHY62106.1 amino acid ABC transporter [Shewanella xiamenensis]